MEVFSADDDGHRSENGAPDSGGRTHSEPAGTDSHDRHGHGHGHGHQPLERVLAGRHDDPPRGGHGLTHAEQRADTDRVHRPEPTRDAHGHGHGHGHGYGEQAGSSLVGRVRHAVSEVFGAHSHDAADQVDEALEADADGRRALLISLGILAATAAAQGVVVAMSGSVALLGDTLHNVADALTAVPLLIAFRLARRPPTKRYTYGYGRAEDLAGIFVIAMITLSSVVAAYEAFERLINPRGVDQLGAVAVAAVLGFVGNEVVARYRIQVGRRIGSAALVADGLHARTDGFTSLAVLLGVLGVAAGWDTADPIIGLTITLAILGVLRSAVRQVGARLMDAVDPDLVDRTAAAAAAVPGVREVRALRLRWIGHTLHAEVDVAVADDLSLIEAHELAHRVEADLMGRIGRLTSASVHAGPSGPHATVVATRPATASRHTHP